MTLTIRNYIGEVEIEGKRMGIHLRGAKARCPLFKKNILERIQNLINHAVVHCGVSSPEDIASISDRQISTRTGHILEWGAHAGIVSKTLGSTLIKKVAPLPDPHRADKAHAPMKIPGVADVTFRNVDGHPSDQIKFPTRSHSEDEVLAVEEETRRLCELRGKKFDPLKKKCLETMIGVGLGSVHRPNYRMVIEGPLATDFCGQARKLISTEVFAKNSPVREGAITASYNRYADTTTLMRKIESKDGSSDLYTGRPDTYNKAVEQARFMFLSEILSPAKVRKGIVENTDGTFEFTYAVQSLLTVGQIPFAGERKMVEAELKAFEQLRGKTIEIEHGGKTYKVKINPLPIAVMNYNFATTLEDFLPHEISGKLFADELTSKSDFALSQYVCAARPLDSTLLQALYNLGDSELKPWQKLMNRAYICERLKIPFVVHCKSSVDRTNVAAAMITAMKQWLLSGEKIPNNNIHEIVDRMTVGEKGPYNPFKELFAYALTKGLKITELARYEKGFKLHLGWMQNRALHDLLPDRYLRKTTAKEHAATIVHTLLILVATAVAIVANLVFIVINKSNKARLNAAVDTFGTLWRTLKALVTLKLFTKYQVDEKYEEAASRSLIYDWNLER